VIRPGQATNRQAEGIDINMRFLWSRVHWKYVVVVTFLLVFPSSGQAFLGDVLEGLKQLGVASPQALSEEKIIAGLKEALEVGTGKAVNLTGTVNGFYQNPAIKLPLPESMERVDAALRMVGYGPQLDELVVSMNRAAEEATSLATPIFVNAIQDMNVQDAQGILQGSDTAATEYFKEKTTGHLRQAFQPKVEKAMRKVGVTKQYHDVMNRYESLPFMQAFLFDLDAYVVDGSLDGLFYMVAEEEKKIRNDPAARVTDLLKDVFGKGTP